ncbi:MAG: CvpA family protein [Candidatus Gastranaerophilales bacterium]|nr:CvpA family protein [Candidatus Gastranaerophilales bacterium]
MNLLFVAAVILLIVNVVTGYKRGMVKQVISLVSLVVLCTVAVLVGNGLRSYQNKEFLNVAVAVLLLAALGIAHHLLGIVFFSAKMIAKLPIVHWLDHLLGIVFGALETVLLLWTLYTFVMMMDLGMIGQMIVSYTAENDILTWLYQHNYLAHLIEQYV